MITYFATQPHFIDHLAPIFALTGGEFLVKPSLVAHAAKRGVEARRVWPHETARSVGRGRGPVVTAAFGDFTNVAGSHRPLVLHHHGVGQSFVDRPHGSYSNGPGRDRAGLILEPNEYAAAHSRAAYPQAQVVGYGTAKLDAWPFEVQTGNPDPVVAISFHWDCKVAPETRSAWPHYGEAALLALREAFPDRVLGHAHPRIFPELWPVYEALGIEPVADFEEVMRRADVYAIDGVSTLYEFAATGRPVVVLNAPWFRRDVEHGLRFWEYADVGVQVDHPHDLVGAVHEALHDRPEQRALREWAVEFIYPNRGHAAEVAAAEIVRFAGETGGTVMASAIYSTRRLSDGRYAIKGVVDGEQRTVVAELGDAPGINEVTRALEAGGSPPAEVAPPAAVPPVPAGAATPAAGGGGDSTPPVNEQQALAVAALLDPGVDTLRSLLDEVRDVPLLRAALAFETSDAGKRRKTAEAVIEERIAAVEAEDAAVAAFLVESGREARPLEELEGAELIDIAQEAGVEVEDGFDDEPAQRTALINAIAAAVLAAAEEG